MASPSCPVSTILKSLDLPAQPLGLAGEEEIAGYNPFFSKVVGERSLTPAPLGGQLFVSMESPLTQWCRRVQKSDCEHTARGQLSEED